MSNCANNHTARRIANLGLTPLREKRGRTHAALLGAVLLAVPCFLTATKAKAVGETEHASISTDGMLGTEGGFYGSLSADGRYVAFASAANNLVPGDHNAGGVDIFVRDRQTKRTIRVNIPSSGWEAIGNSRDPAISANGRVIAFQSDAANLVPGDTNSAGDVFVRDLRTRQTTRVSVDSLGN